VFGGCLCLDLGGGQSPILGGSLLWVRQFVVSEGFSFKAHLSPRAFVNAICWGVYSFHHSGHAY
jgi:hypothetical protein